MKLWLLTQGERCSYDTFDSVVVAAETEEEAKKIHPTEIWDWAREEPYDFWKNQSFWAKTPEGVDAELLGEAVAGTEAGIVLASFNAG